MMQAARWRIVDRGGVLTVWAVLREDVYESKFGDGVYLHLHGLALDRRSAARLAVLGGESEWVKWHVRSYRLGLQDDYLTLARPLVPEEEFNIDQLVALLFEIPRGAVATRLLIGVGRREDGPFVSLT